jgi:hypothetical protein
MFHANRNHRVRRVFSGLAVEKGAGTGGAPVFGHQFEALRLGRKWFHHFGLVSGGFEPMAGSIRENILPIIRQGA